MSKAKSNWIVPALLFTLSLIPALGGGARLFDLAAATSITPENARFHADPIPIIIHAISATIFCSLGAFQFSASIRRNSPNWHRKSGRIIAFAGIIAALSGVWMAYFYPNDSQLLINTRYVFGILMALFICLAVHAVLQKRIAQHRAWMIRSYAIAINAATILLVLGPWFLLFGEPTIPEYSALMLVSWITNLVIAEWIIRRKPRSKPRALA